MNGPPALHVVGAAILRSGRCLVAQRGPGMSLAGLWEFPGGKVEPRESPQRALIRELREELGVGIEVGPWLGRGESRSGAREVVLDVYAATLVAGEPQPREHAQLRWIPVDEIDTLEWPEADRPVLASLRRVLERGLEADPMPDPVPIVSVDWASRVGGRALYVARPVAAGWRIERPPPPKTGWRFEDVLSLAEAIGEPFDGAALVAIDAVLGLPRTYGLRAEGEGFLTAVEGLEASGGLDQTSREPGDWSPASPFFAVPAGPGGLTLFLDHAGGRAVLYRQLERATGARPVFVRSGIPGTVGSGSIALWRELLAARRARPDRFRIWPFEVELDALPSARCIAIAESYPRACYAVALSDALPTGIVAVAKGDPRARRRGLDALREADWVRGRSVEITGFDAAEASADDFDALMQAIALARLVDARIPLAAPLVDPVWEGGILGTGGLTIGAPRVTRSR